LLDGERGSVHGGFLFILMSRYIEFVLM